MAKLTRYIFFLFNQLYRYQYWLYRPLYFQYKTLSDGKKIRLIKDVVQEGDQIVDIGANIGYYTRLFARLVGIRGTVIAFEPEKRNFGFLQQNTSEYDHVRVFMKAVGSEAGIIQLFYSKDLNVDHQTYDSGEGRSISEVEQISMDDYFGTRSFNFIKIDIQGYDYWAMLGMKKILSASPSLIILGELWPYGLQKSGASSSQYLSLLSDHGFLIFFFEELTIGALEDKVDDLSFYTDYLAIKPALFHNRSFNPQKYNLIRFDPSYNTTTVN